MNRITSLAVLGVCVGLCVATGVTAQPVAKPGDLTDFVVSAMRVQDLKATNYIYLSSEVTIPTISEAVTGGLGKIRPAIDDGSVKAKGAPLLLFHGMSGDPNQKFTMDVGVPTADDAAEKGDFKVKKLEAFHCATVIFNGGVKDIGQAYEMIYRDIAEAGLQPTGETRQAMLQTEGKDSPNTVLMIEVEVK